MNDMARLLALSEQSDIDPQAAADLLGMLNLRGVDTGGPGTALAFAVDGLDLYVRRSPDGGQRAVSVGTEELPAGVTAVVEAWDGLSWEQELP